MRSRFSCLGLLIFASLLMIERGSAQTPLSADVLSKIEPADRAEITQAFATRPRVRVIVVLATDDQGRLAWDASESGTRAQSERTRARQRTVISRHFGFAATEADSTLARSHSITVMEISPMFAADVDRARLDALARDPDVAHLHLDRLNKPHLSTSTRTIGMTGESGAWNFGADGKTNDVWPYGIAILDTGVRVNHPFLRNRLSERDMCFSTESSASDSTSLCGNGRPSLFGVGAADDCDPAVINGCGHGTHVAGIAAGVLPTLWRGGGPPAGVARAAKIQAVKIFSRIDDAKSCKSEGGSPCALTFASDIIRALDRIYADRFKQPIVQPVSIRAINMSLGDGRFSAACPGDPRAPVIRNLRSAGILTMISAGNDGYTDAVNAPACIPEAITVGNAVAGFDAAGALQLTVSDSSNNGRLVDVFAPGEDIRSAGSDTSGPGLWAIKSGTSMAAPHVAGAYVAMLASLWKANAPVAQRTPDAIETALEITGVLLTDRRPGGLRIRPFIQVDRALSRNLPEKPLTLSGSRFSPLVFTATAGFAPTPLTRSLALSTISSGPTRVTVTNEPAWLDVTPDFLVGTFLPGQTMRFRPNLAARGLAPGSYTSVVKIRQGRLNQSIYRTVRYDVAPSPPPPNDRFFTASRITPVLDTPVVVDGWNMGATLEPGEFAHRNGARGTVWYRVTAIANGELTVRAEPMAGQFPMKPKVAVYRGSDVAALTEVAVDLQNSTASVVSPDVISGQEYMIMVGGAAEGTSFSFGFFRLTVTQRQAVLTATPIGTLGFVKRVGEAPVPANQVLTLVASGGRAAFQVIQKPPWTDVSPISGLVSVFPAEITLVPNAAANALLVGSHESKLVVSSATTGQTFERTVRIEIRSPSSAPGNDNLADAAPINGVRAGASITVAGSNNNATREVDEPRNPATQGNKSVWWTFTAQNSSIVKVSTAGSNFDTTVAVYWHLGFGVLSHIASNDDRVSGDLSSYVEFSPVIGRTYVICVDGYLAGTITELGSITLNVSQNFLIF